MSNNNILVILAGILCMCFTGCGSISEYEPLGSGYIWVTHTQRGIIGDTSSQFELKYSPGENKWWKKVWPDLYGGIAVTNGMCVFLAEVASERPEDFFDRWPLKTRLFAVRAPETPLDITHEVLMLTAKGRGRELSELAKTASFSTLNQTNDGIEIRIASIKWFENVNLNWNQMSDIMKDVKDHGVERKDLRWGTKYIEKDYKPDAQK